ncbi:MAG: histidine phosphatase family protein [Rhizomicrobium sp.]
MSAFLGPVYGHATYVMRHGQTVLDDEKRSDGWLDYPLSDKGRIGLMDAQQFLKLAPIRTVYAPTLRRAEETGHIIASGILNHPKEVVADAAKTWNLGTLIGSKKKPNKPLVHYFMDHPNETPMGGESMQAFCARWIPWLLKTVHKDNGASLIVTSGSNLRAIGTALYGDTDKFDLDEGGLMVLLPEGNSANGQVIFGHKDGDEEDFS